MSKVALVKCETYDYDTVREAVRRGIELLGGAGKYARADEKILIKPNLLSADPPEKCSTTHYTVFKAVAAEFLETNAIVSYGDSPGFHSPTSAAGKSKIMDAASELGIKLSDFERGEEVPFHEGIQNKRFYIAKGVLENDGIISVSKLKAHGLTRITGAVKNQFGCIPGLSKGEFHAKLPDALGFARMLVDLNRLLKPRLYIMDGIMAMEGNGPRNGNPKKMGVLLFSCDPVALDATVCRMIDLEPDYVPTIKYGAEYGLGTYENIEILGDSLDSFRDPSFAVVREPVKAYKSGGAIQFFRNTVIPKPYIVDEKCKRCGVCVKVCPVSPKAVDWHNGDKASVPAYRYKNCIRCYCCQELCPEGAINLRLPLIRRLAFKGKKS